MQPSAIHGHVLGTRTKKTLNYLAFCGGAGGIRTHEWRFCRPLPWASWVPRLNGRSVYRNRYILSVIGGLWNCRDDVFQTHATQYFGNVAIRSSETTVRARNYAHSYVRTASTCASRKKRADSSGGVGQM